MPGHFSWRNHGAAHQPGLDLRRHRTVRAGLERRFQRRAAGVSTRLQALPPTWPFGHLEASANLRRSVSERGGGDAHAPAATALAACRSPLQGVGLGHSWPPRTENESPSSGSSYGIHTSHQAPCSAHPGRMKRASCHPEVRDAPLSYSPVAAPAAARTPIARADPGCSRWRRRCSGRCRYRRAGSGSVAADVGFAWRDWVGSEARPSPRSLGPLRSRCLESLFSALIDRR
jgi:hypothetical protein